MSRFFSDFVASLAAGEEISPDRFDAVWAALRRLLSRELRRRGLADHPPSYLGIYGHTHWFGADDATTDPESRRSGALEELAADCYAYIFWHRLRSLNAQRQVKDSIEGLIFLNIRHFIHDRQRIHDPIGLRTYEMVRSAIESMLDSGVLSRLDAGSKLRSGTLLAFRELASEIPAAVDLRARVRAWNEDLMPELLTARGAARRELIEALRSRIDSLRDEGIEAFRFGELLEPLRFDVRARWAALFDSDQEELAVEDVNDPFRTMTRRVLPATDFEERQRFDRLAECVEHHLARSTERASTRNHLQTLWRFLRAEALGETPENARDETANPDRPRSMRQLARILNIPRSRISGFFQTLGRYLETCRQANSPDSPVNSEGGAAATRDRGHS